MTYYNTVKTEELILNQKKKKNFSLKICFQKLLKRILIIHT